MKKRKDGRYQKKVTYKGSSKTAYGKTINELAQDIKRIEQILKNEEKTKELFETWLDKWWDHHQTTIKYNTIECYKKPVQDVREQFKDRMLDDIKPSEIKTFIDKLASQQFARQTINLRHIVLCKTFDYAMANDVDISNPARAVKLPRGLKSTKRETLTDNEIEKVKASKDLFANFLLYTGTRKNEALAIEWSDIDFKNKTIRIKDAIVYINNKPTFNTGTKTAKGIRTIPLLEPLEDILKPISKKSGYIFNKSGEPLERKQARLLWENFAKQTELSATPHQFRHAFITMLYYAGIDVKTAQAIVGHSKVDTLLNIYTHLDSLKQNTTADKINNFLKSSQPNSQQ